MKKALSLRQAQRCETAKTPHCRCRCGGVLHGSARGMDETFFEALPEGDPHKAAAPGKRKRRKKAKAMPLLEGL